MGELIRCPLCGSDKTRMNDARTRDKCVECGAEFNDYRPPLPEVPAPPPVGGVLMPDDQRMPSVDAEGYPTEAALLKLREWPITDCRGWLEYARSLWWARDWGWPTLEGEVSTGGWSGNESIIEAMQAAHSGIMWNAVWWNTRKGGHYTLALTEPTAPHPDTVRMDWLSTGGMKLVNPTGGGVPATGGAFLTVYGEDGTGSPSGYAQPTMRDCVDAAIDAARAAGDRSCFAHLASEDIGRAISEIRREITWLQECNPESARIYIASGYQLSRRSAEEDDRRVADAAESIRAKLASHQSLIKLLESILAVREPIGTYACPRCGKETPHEHATRAAGTTREEPRDE